MNSKLIKLYQDRVSLNKETVMFMNTIGVKWFVSLINNNKIVFSPEVNDETKETSEWVGIVSTMKIFTKK